MKTCERCGGTNILLEIPGRQYYEILSDDGNGHLEVEPEQFWQDEDGINNYYCDDCDYTLPMRDDEQWVVIVKGT